MIVAFLNISFSIFNRRFSFWRALNYLRVTVSSSDILTEVSCFIHVLSVLLPMPYSRFNCGYDFPPALYKSTICCLNSGVYRFWFFATLNISFVISIAIIDGSTFSVHTYILTPTTIYHFKQNNYSFMSDFENELLLQMRCFFMKGLIWQIFHRDNLSLLNNSTVAVY